MTVDRYSDCTKNITLKFEDVDTMSDEQFKQCIATLVSVKYGQAKQVDVCCRKELCSTDRVEVDVELTVKY